MQLKRGLSIDTTFDPCYFLLRQSLYCPKVPEIEHITVCFYTLLYGNSYMYYWMYLAILVDTYTLLPFFHSVVTGSEKGCQMLQILWLSLFVTNSNCYLHLTVSTDWLKRKPDKNEDKPYAETKVTKIWQILCESPFSCSVPHNSLNDKLHLQYQAISRMELPVHMYGPNFYFAVFLFRFRM